MIRDGRVFRTDWTPEDLHHRHGELQQLSSYLSPIEEGREADPASIFGPTGTGKTAAAEELLRQLRKSVVDLDTILIDCWNNHGRFQVLRELLELVNAPTHDLRQDRTSRDEMLARFREHKDDLCVVVLDEVDQLDDEGVLRDLWQTDGVCLLFIANREDDFYGTLDDRLQSRLLTSQVVKFEPYGVDALTDILRSRASAGLARDAIRTAELRTIADTARGDARVAIRGLKNAAEAAEHRGTRRIGQEDIKGAVPKARAEIRQKTKSKLIRHQRLLFEIIEEHGELSASDLHDAYEAEAENPRSKRQRRNYLTKLERYNLIEREGERRWTTYRVVEAPVRS